jgi:hypothetical protein
LNTPQWTPPENAVRFISGSSGSCYLRHVPRTCD